MDNQFLTMDELDAVAGGLIHEGTHAGSSGSTGSNPRDRFQDAIKGLLRKIGETNSFN